MTVQSMGPIGLDMTDPFYCGHAATELTKGVNISVIRKLSGVKSKTMIGPCHSSDGQWPASHRGDPDSIPEHSVWDLLWTGGTGAVFLRELQIFPC
jgi:hypothetical protein